MTTQEPRRYKTIFFDLDGTLLPIDMDTFLREYFSKLKAFADKRGYDGEKILFAVDELTGLIGAAAKMRPSGSVQDMELKSLKKKYKTPSFAAGCSRDVIARGAEQLGWELDTLLERTLGAMKRCEPEIAAAVAQQTT